MKTLNLDLNFLSDDELEMYMILKKATKRIEHQKENIVSQREKLEQNIKEANKGWMEKDKLPEPPKMPLGKFPEQ